MEELATAEVKPGLFEKVSISIDGLPAAWQSALRILARPQLNEGGGNIQSLCASLGVSRAAAYAAMAPVVERLNRRPDGLMGRLETLERDLARSKKETRESQFENDVLKFRLDHPGCISGLLRQNFTEEFKTFIIESRRRHAVTIERAAEILS